MNLLPDAPSSHTSHEPLYNIGVVTRITGISMATLRAWERRYDFPEASRTLGGHRLYSERDIMRLKWVKLRIGEGMQTAQAIQALRHQETANEESWDADKDRLSQEKIQAAAVGPFTNYQEQLYRALLQRNLQKADHLLGESLAVSSPEDLIVNVIGPTISAIGDAWERHHINIATEHLATNYLRQRLLMWMVSGPPPQPVQPVVLACAPDEWHEGSLLMLAALLRRQRWPVAYLGQAVPLPDLGAFVHDIRPLAVILVAMTEASASALLEWPQWLPEAANSGRPAICYGGRIFNIQPEWQMRMPGEFLGSNIQQGAAAMEKLLKSLS